MNSDSVFKTFIDRKLYIPGRGVVLTGFFLTILISFGVRNSELENTFLVNTENLIPVYSTDTIPILSVNGDSIGFVNPFFVFYLDKASGIHDLGTGHIYVWIWNESININSGEATALNDENIRTSGNREKLGRIRFNSPMEVNYHRPEYQWSLVKINTEFKPEARLNPVSRKDLKSGLFHRLHLYTTDFSYFSVHEDLRYRFIDISTLFIKQPSLSGIIINQIIFLGILLIALIVVSGKKNRVLRIIAFSYSYSLGIIFCLLMNWIIGFFFQ
jgi:hypothetical protein